jgi:hypothetical protein
MSTEKQETTIGTDADFSRAMFDSFYRRRITIKDWFFTKKGLFAILFLLVMAATDNLGAGTLMVWAGFCMYSYMNEKIMLHERDKYVYGYVIMQKLYDHFLEYKNNEQTELLAKKEGEEILESWNLLLEDETKDVKKVKPKAKPKAKSPSTGKETVTKKQPRKKGKK